MFYDRLQQELTQLQSDGLFKSERALSSAQARDHRRCRFPTRHGQPLLEQHLGSPTARA